MWKSLAATRRTKGFGFHNDNTEWKGRTKKRFNRHFHATASNEKRAHRKHKEISKISLKASVGNQAERKLKDISNIVKSSRHTRGISQSRFFVSLFSVYPFCIFSLFNFLLASSKSSLFSKSVIFFCLVYLIVIQP